jgi:NADH-quinone oxidoreductase subunit N
MTTDYGFDLIPALPEVFLLLAALALLVVGAMRDNDAARVVTPLAALALLVAALFVIGADKSAAPIFGGHFVFDSFAAFLKVIIFLGSAVAILLAQGYLQDQDIDRFEFPLLILLAALGMSMMVSANSFLALYMGLELQSLPLYVLAAFNRDQLRSTEAGLKYFVLGALASGMLLYGCSLVYGFTGTLNFDELGTILTASEGGVTGLGLGALSGLVFITAGLAFKLSAVPFHMWAPDVYEGAPTPVTAFFAAAPKVAAVGLTLRVLMQPFGSVAGEWQQIIVFISIASMLLGAFAAIRQTNIKRLLAYSGIGHIGFALVGLAAGTERGIYGVLIYMAIYLVMTIGTFAVVLMMRRQGRYIETIDDLAGLSTTRPLLAAAMAIFMFSLAGIPPLAGFFGKLYVFMAAVEAGLTPLAVIGVLASVVGAYYYLRIVKLMYFDEPAEAFDRQGRFELQAVVTVSAVLVLGFILIPGPLLATAQAAAAALMP